jgi:DNA polymerase-1
MDSLAEIYLDYETVHFKDIVPKDKLFQDIELDIAADYAAEDADITFRLYEILSKEIEKGGLGSLFYDTEMPLVYILAEMELEGVRLRKEALEVLSRDLEKKIAEISDEVFKLCGKEFNISSPKQLQEILFTDRKLKPGKKTKTGFSTDNTVLEILAGEDPVPSLVLKYRVLAKLKSTYVDALPKLIQDKTSRIHTTYRQTGTQTGRLSSTNPNLQNIPIKDEEGRKIRKAFIPSGGKVFLSADYAQIELVVLAHLSEDPALIKAFTEGIDVHRMTGSLIFQVAPEEVSSDGMSGFRLSRELKIPRKQADEFINSYFDRYANIRGFIDKTVSHAEEAGSVSTILGRERFIAGINSKNRNEKNGAERMAVNTPIQGSAADIVKLAMLKIDEKLKDKDLKSKLVLQVHDELIYEVPFSEVEIMKSLVREEMENVYKLKVPLHVSIETGESWGEMH